MFIWNFFFVATCRFAAGISLWKPQSIGNDASGNLVLPGRLVPVGAR